MRAHEEIADVDRALCDLPEDFIVAVLGDVRFVAGPTGAYVIRAADPDDSSHDEEIGEIAGRTRALLAQHLQWVPFVHALVVADGPLSLLRATCVPERMLLELLTAGRTLIEPATLERIQEVVNRRVLDAAVQGNGLGDEIDLGRYDSLRSRSRAR